MDRQRKSCVEKLCEKQCKLENKLQFEDSHWTKFCFKDNSYWFSHFDVEILSKSVSTVKDYNTQVMYLSSVDSCTLSTEV